jgi:hypothetical protein
MKYWITQTGEKLKVREMETSHIENCIKMLKRLLDTRPPEQVYMGESDYAEEAVEQENRINEDRAEAIESTIDSFKRELKMRKEPKSKFKPYNAVIQACNICGKVDVSEGHEKDCDPEFEEQRRINQDYYD